MPDCELENAGIENGSDGHEFTIAHAVIRIHQIRSVEGVEGFGPKTECQAVRSDGILFLTKDRCWHSREWIRRLDRQIPERRQIEDMDG
jgi:hypothetical protein